ncbi:MAG: glucose 1-dehydrogenase [Steroidobacteraceae bacterium]
MKKIALVTGGGSGIGRATAHAFADVGATVVVADCNKSAADATVEAIVGKSRQAISVAVDVSVASSVREMVRVIDNRYGRLDWAFNNAAIMPRKADLVDLSEEEWDRLMDINLKGPWLCMKHEIPLMLKSGGGAIVNTASMNGLVALPAAAGYVASKFGVIGLSKSAAIDYAARGIRINAVCPGMTETPMFATAAAERSADASAIAGLLPIGRIGTPEEIAQAVVWLCSDQASYLVGHALVVDGGFTSL